jgi:hypothetical protein
VVKLWWLGLVLLVGGLVFVPTSYFAIIFNEYPQPVNLALFASWVLGVVAVPVGFVILVYCALRRSPSVPAQGDKAQSGTLTGLYLILAGLLVVPMCYFAIVLSDLPRALDFVLLVVGGLFWLAVPVGIWLFVTSARHHDANHESNRGAPAAAVPVVSGSAADLLAMLDVLRSAGVLTQAEYDEKRRRLAQSGAA